MRGLACVLMFQTHCFDSWLAPEARDSLVFHWSRRAGTLPAPLFLFLAGISFALVTDKLRKRNIVRGEIARTTIRRGAEIFGLSLLFRLQQYAFSWRWVPWTDLLRVDVLNTIGVSMMLMGLLCWMTAFAARAEVPAGSDARSLRWATVVAAAGAALAISLAAPPLWTTHRLRCLPWPLESYINGVHIFAEPKGWFFPIFPWAGFAFAGLATGFILLSDWARRHEARVFAAFGIAGVAVIAGSRWLDHQPWQFYAVYDYWTSSPEFFLLRVGLLLVIMSVVYAWCRWGAAQTGFSPFIQFGQTSLLVYWVHIEFVYNRLIILPSHANSVPVASAGLLFIIVLMLILSVIRTRTKGRGAQMMARLRTA
jgi:uncharacterized membrane protein